MKHIGRASLVVVTNDNKPLQHRYKKVICIIS